MGKTTWGGVTQSALNWLFPPRCAGCGRLGTVWCERCQQTTGAIREPVCPRCGRPGSEKSCPACSHFEYAFDVVRSWAVYQGELRRAILAMKHRRNGALGLQFAAPLREMLETLDWVFDVIVPIPLDGQRLQKRGYNQVDLFGKPLAEAIGKPYQPQMLVRTHSTIPQFELDARARWKNLKGSFAAAPDVQNLRILLLDDIMTTGATLSAAAEALKTAGARNVMALTIARTLFEGND